MKSLTDKIETEAFLKRFNIGRYINRIALGAILSLSYPGNTSSYYKDVNKALDDNSVVYNVVIDGPKTPSLDNYQFHQLDNPQLEERRQYNGKRNDTLSLEDIADEGLRRDVRRRLNGTNVHEFRRITGRIERFSAIIESYSKAYDIDDKLLAGVTYQESAGNSKAKSRKGAMGLMQVTYGAVSDITGRRLADITKEEIMNPKNNIEFGTGYLSDLIQRYNGSIVLGLAAYNVGPTKLDRILSELSKNKNIGSEEVSWYDIKYMLPRETREYVPGVLSKVLKMQEQSTAKNYAARESEEGYIN